jgi:hypothetical protein
MHERARLARDLEQNAPDRRPPTRTVSRRLTVGATDDRAEVEADQVAAQVVDALARPAGPFDQRPTRVRLSTAGAAHRAVPPSGQRDHAPPDGGAIGPAGGELDDPTSRAVDGLRGRGRPLDDQVRAPMESVFGRDLGAVRIHSGAVARDLNDRIQAAAFTVGNDMFFRDGAPDIAADAGRHLLGHELTHVAQQGAGASRQIRRTYAALPNAMAKARVDAVASRDYATKAAEFEFKMAALIQRDPATNAEVDLLLAQIKKIVDAWAESTGRAKDEAYEREFGWSGGDTYYGAFEMTARNIKKVFSDPAQPMRSKLKIIYNAVRNNNLAKWLKLAAIELDRAAQGKTARAWKIKTAAGAITREDPRTGAKKLVKTAGEKEEVQPGFAAKAGLDTALSTAQVQSFAKIAETEKATTGSRSKRDVFGHDKFSNVVGWHADTRKANLERRPGASAGLTLPEQRTLTAGDVTDLTDAEIALLYKRQGKAAPGKKARNKFRGKATNKIEWNQGGEHFDIQLDSDSAKAAATISARLEAGISGSTDLMMHAVEDLGVTDLNRKKTLRLALAGWMMANRDHSFYEVYKSAASYGVPFTVDTNDHGAEYEVADHLYPMQRADFVNVLPEKVFPKYFLSTAHKDTIAATLVTKAKDADHFRTLLKAEGIDATVVDGLDERGTAEMSRLVELVRAAPIDGDERIALKMVTVRRIKQDQSFVYLGRVLGEAVATKLLNALLTTHHAAKGVAGGDDAAAALADAGVPPSIMSVLGSKVAHLETLRLAIKAGGIDATTGTFRYKAPTKAITQLRKVISAQELQDVQAVLMQTYHGSAALSAPAKTTADESRKMAAVQQVASMVQTTGWWYSWGPMGYLKSAAKSRSIRAFTAGGDFEQGPGLYLASTPHSSSTYGDGPGKGLLAVHLQGVPTLNRTNKAQMKILGEVTGTSGMAGDPIKNAGLYHSGMVVELFMIYNGAGTWGRLTTNRGVAEMTTDLSKPPLTDLTGSYGRMVAGAQANVRAQAAQKGVVLGTATATGGPPPPVTGAPPPPPGAPPPPPPLPV